MKTSKPVSTISFNSEAYLRGKLRELTAAGVLEFWAYIRHDPEPDEVGDEAGGKQHFHVYMEPAKMIQTTDLRAAFSFLWAGPVTRAPPWRHPPKMQKSFAATPVLGGSRPNNIVKRG